MAWTYSNWTTLDGAAQKTAFNLHLQEITDKIDTNMSMAGRSEQSDNLVKYYEAVVAQGKNLGLISLRTTGRSTKNEVKFKDPCESVPASAEALT